MSAARTARRSVDLGVRLDRLNQAELLRDERLAQGLSAQPADRDAAESAITSLYGLVGAAPPTFIWVASPAAAAPALAEAGCVASTADLRHEALPVRLADWPVAHRLALLAAELRHAFDDVLERPGVAWNPSPADHARLLPDAGLADAVRQGVPLRLAIQAGIHLFLYKSLEDSVRKPVRDELFRPTPGAAPRHLAWYGQHEVWAAYLDILRRAGLILPDPAQRRQLDLWAALYASCGWWWPHDRVCVICERPLAVRTEPRPGARHAGRCLHCEDGPAIAYPDGWRVHSIHGTLVPEWVITGPTPERVAAESNSEIRRCAIERIGWDAFVAGAGLDLVGTASDPGNPGGQLRLYDVPFRVWGAGVRLLVATNGSVERDGTRRTYGLTVPRNIDHPLTAAAWTYGLPAYLYARLDRRT